jgi:hypothetical protein
MHYGSGELVHRSIWLFHLTVPAGCLIVCLIHSVDISLPGKIVCSHEACVKEWILLKLDMFSFLYSTHVHISSSVVQVSSIICCCTIPFSFVLGFKSKGHLQSESAQASKVANYQVFNYASLLSSLIQGVF